MINSLKSPIILFRDGTSQQDRKTNAIEPDYISVEGRSIEDLIGEAQRLAKELQFFNSKNESIAGETWESFLIADPVAYNQEPEFGSQRKMLREQWASQLAAYIENPERFSNDQDKKEQLSRPHLVLFMTFLKLLNHVKAQINGLTQKHLEFYFRERLAITPKEAVPDVVNVLLELAEGIEYLEVKKGTILQAGEDNSGNELHYQIDENTIISQAKISELKNIFIEKELLTIKEAQLRHKDAADFGLSSMMEMALGHPDPGDKLPEFPSGVADLIELEFLVQQGDANALLYVEESLFLSVADFQLIIRNCKEQKIGVSGDWDTVYEMLDSAYKEKIKQRRKKELKAFHETKGFDSLIKKIFGELNEGDDLPLYEGSKASLDIIFENLEGTSGAREQALVYVNGNLKLNEENFRLLVQISKKENAAELEWSKVYLFLEVADRQIRSLYLPSPTIEKITELYSNSNAGAFTFSQYGADEESKRFKTFGNRLEPESGQVMQPAEIGFAISSPILLLKEGTRKIEVILDLGLKNNEISSLQAIFENKSPLTVQFSSINQWFSPNATSFTFGNYTGIESEDSFASEIDGNRLKIIDEKNFTLEDVGKYIVDNTIIYEIMELASAKTVVVHEVGCVENNNGKAQKYASNQVYLKALKIEAVLSKEELPVLPLADGNASGLIASDYPLIRLTLHHNLENNLGQNIYSTNYQELLGFAVYKAHIRVDVKGIRDITLQNDQNSIDLKKTYEPFGLEPEAGDSFYIANEEICQKKLHHLSLDVQWVKQPESFREYYKNYWLIDADNMALDAESYLIKDNSDFKIALYFHDRNAEILVTSLREEADALALFSPSGTIEINSLPSKMQYSNPNYKYKPNAKAIIIKEDVIEWERYFRIELGTLDFQHSLYNTLFLKQVLSDHPEIKSLRIKPPYQPKVKKMEVGYSASVDISVAEIGVNSLDTLFHIHPFGYELLDIGQNPGLLPRYEDEGSLFIGIEALKLPQVLSILFQMAAGSANPDMLNPELQWSYLQDNKWLPLKSSSILLDTTNGLLNTGVVKVDIPADATNTNTLLPAQLHWLRVVASKNSGGISDTIDIVSQVISATLSNTSVDPLHFENPLAAYSIAGSVPPLAEIAAIKQPYTSFKGKQAEKGNDLHVRISERLRHKNRAITIWDYERMVLNEFPQVYKAKCVPSAEQLGQVDVIIIPDIIGSLPFNPFAPKVPADLLKKIHNFLNNQSSSYAEIVVKNPFYLQILTRCTVKFNLGCDATYYQQKLIEEIKRFLSPWAYSQDGDIRLGGILHSSVLINFIAERPYIDYVANLKLFQSEDGIKFKDVRSINAGKSIVVASRPEMVIVSGPTHFIDLVDENGYDEESFEGINYMQIQLDFEVAKDF